MCAFCTCIYPKQKDFFFPVYALCIRTHEIGIARVAGISKKKMTGKETKQKKIQIVKRERQSKYKK